MDRGLGRSGEATDLLRGELISGDPILYDVKTYDRFRKTSRDRLKSAYGNILDILSEQQNGLLPFSHSVRQLICELESKAGPTDNGDPYLSSAVRAFFARLRWALDWAGQGAEASILMRCADLAALEDSIALERGDGSFRFKGADCQASVDGIRVVPVEWLARSPLLAGRIDECLPGYPHGGSYVSLTPARYQAVLSHIRTAIGQLKRLDQVAYEGFRRNVNTIYVSITKGTQSFGTRPDLPGSIVAGIDDERLSRGDSAFTASQLYHEHCHLKLALFVEALDLSLPSESVFISPFKNETRDFESILHTVYPIAMECGTRLDLLGAYRGVSVQRALSYLIAVGYRLSVMTDIFTMDSFYETRPEFAEIAVVSRRVLHVVQGHFNACPPEIKRAHWNEQRKVLRRHAWDIGQFLCRGVRVRDPGLTSVRKTHHGYAYTFRGQPQRATWRPGRFSEGRYGSYLESTLKRIGSRSRRTTPR